LNQSTGRVPLAAAAPHFGQLFQKLIITYEDRYVHDPAVYRRGTFHPTCKTEKLFLFLLALLSHRLLGKRKE